MSLRGLVRIARPKQWLKNLLVLFPPFLSGALAHPGVMLQGLLPFAAFCCASSAAYVLNDLLDAEKDAAHPQKCRRPLPAGMISRGSAWGFFGVLLGGATLIAAIASPSCFAYVSLYLIVSISYSLKFKELPVADIFFVAFGFVLRLYGGGAAFGVIISDWLFLTVFLLSVFLIVGKRYSEKKRLGVDAGVHRRTLDAYPMEFLSGALYFTGSAVLVTYSLYAIATPLLVYSVPLCMFGLFRYLHSVSSGGDGDPTEVLLKDGQLLLTALLWATMVGLAVYR